MVQPVVFGISDGKNMLGRVKWRYATEISLLQLYKKSISTSKPPQRRM